jgi:hypothetical protein
MVVIITRSILAGLAANSEVVRAINPGAAGDEPFIDLGEGGTLLTGGGLKGLSRYTSSREALIDLRRVFRARRGGELVPAPVVDFLGLTESIGLFGGRAGSPDDDNIWIKCPHPLTWVGPLESPSRLHLVPDDEFDQQRLLFYVSFVCLDYLEAIVSGDVITRRCTPDFPQHGFVYQRRVGEDEGFQVREGCGA